MCNMFCNIAVKLVGKRCCEFFPLTKKTCFATKQVVIMPYQGVTSHVAKQVCLGPVKGNHSQILFQKKYKLLSTFYKTFSQPQRT